MKDERLVVLNNSENVTELNDGEIREQVQSYYAQRATSGASCCGDDVTNTLYSEELLTGVPDELANFSLGCGDPITVAELQEGEVVLDLGSGGGLDCFMAGKLVGDSGRVIGIDMTPEMLERARTVAAKIGAENVEFRKGLLEDMPVEDNSIDVIISNCVINLSPDKQKVFEEMQRVLKPGGRVSVSDIVTNGELPEEIKKDMLSWGGCVAGALDVKEYQRGLTDADFENIHVMVKSGEELQDLIPEKLPVFSAAITAKKPE